MSPRFRHLPAGYKAFYRPDLCTQDERFRLEDCAAKIVARDSIPRVADVHDDIRRAVHGGAAAGGNPVDCHPCDTITALAKAEAPLQPFIKFITLRLY
jgi:hypothetical protein